MLLKFEGKIWRLDYRSPYSLMFTSAEVLCYVVLKLISEAAICKGNFDDRFLTLPNIQCNLLPSSKLKLMCEVGYKAVGSGKAGKAMALPVFHLIFTEY